MTDRTPLTGPMYWLDFVPHDALDGLMENLSLVFHGTLSCYISGDSRQVRVLPLGGMLCPQRFLLFNKPSSTFLNGALTDSGLRVLR